MINSPKPILGFAAYSGTGKTTLLEKLIPQLKEIGLSVSLIKHTHHNFDIDTPGKDSFRLRKAGADQTIVASGKRWALMVEENPPREEPCLSDLLQHLDYSKIDLVLVEGFKHEQIKKIELNRQTLNKPLMAPDDPNVIAIASDDSNLNQLSEVPVNCPILDINRPEQIAQFIQIYINMDKK